MQGYQASMVCFALMRAKEIDQIFFLAPTSTNERINKVRKIASGLHILCTKGVIGSQIIDIENITYKIKLIKSRMQVPLCIGFKYIGSINSTYLR